LGNLLKSKTNMEDQKLIPNSTQIPNVICDMLIPQLPEAEARCILYICRRTFGFHKEEDMITFSQFILGIKKKDGTILDKGTGLSRPSVRKAIKNLLASGAIIVIPTTKGNFYKINLEMDVDKVVKLLNQLIYLTKSGKATLPKQVKLLTPQKKEKEKETKYLVADKQLSAHTLFIKFFHDTSIKTRGVKPIITGKDGKNLKRVLEMKLLTEVEMEQLALYFLANRYYKKFPPSISTFLSAGILNGLINDLKNKEDFWKEISGYSYSYFNSQVPSIKLDNPELKSVGDRLAELKIKLLAPK